MFSSFVPRTPVRRRTSGPLPTPPAMCWSQRRWIQASTPSRSAAVDPRPAECRFLAQAGSSHSRGVPWELSGPSNLIRIMPAPGLRRPSFLAGRHPPSAPAPKEEPCRGQRPSCQRTPARLMSSRTAPSPANRARNRSSRSPSRPAATASSAGRRSTGVAARHARSRVKAGEAVRPHRRDGHP